jgi:hypothetical protein
MRSKRARRLAAPFVATLAVGACAKNGETPERTPAPNPPAPTVTATAPPEPSQTAAPTAAPTASIASPENGDGVVFDGYSSCYRLEAGKKVYVPTCPDSALPEPPKDRVVYRYAGLCRSVPDDKAVRCPPGGPTLLLPEETRKGDVSLVIGSFGCHEFQSVSCPPQVACNPPPPRPVPCPPELLPKLGPSVKPTKTEGNRCWYRSVEVACP